jgi:hypothetical protein
MKCSDELSPRRRRPRRNPRDCGLAAPCLASGVLYAEIPRNRIALYRFLIEGYDNLAVMSVVDRYRAVIKLRFTPGGEQTLRGLLRAQGARLVEPPASSAGQPEKIAGVVPAALP